MSEERATVEITIGSDLSFARSAISDFAFAEIKNQFRHTNPQYQKMRAMGFGGLNEPKSYECFSVTKDQVRVWRGGVKRLRDLLQKCGYRVKYVDKRLVLPPTGLTLGSMKPHGYQDEAADVMLQFQQGLLRGHTGSGKTETLLIAIVKSQQPAVVTVWNKDLLKQWVERICKYGILDESEIGIIQGGKDKYGPITIAMIQTLYKRVDKWKNRFGVFALDEGQRAPARTFIEGVLPFPARYKWVATADERRKDGKEFLAYEAFGYQDWTEREKSVKFHPICEVEGAGQSLEPTIMVVPTQYTDLEYEENRNFGQLVNRMIEDEDRCDLIASHLKRALEQGRQCILFTERVEAARTWAAWVSEWGFEAGPLIGGQENADETSATLKRLRSGHCRFASTTSYADVGLDVPSLDTAFVSCPTGNNIKRLNQQVGRVVRPDKGKKDPLVYYFWDREVSGVSKAIKKIRSRWKDKVHVLEGELSESEIGIVQRAEANI